MAGPYSSALRERRRLREDTPPVSALADLAAALLPPEHGGPPPDVAAAAAGPLVDAMPPPARAGLGAALLGLDGGALVRHGRRLGALEPEQRVGVLRAVAAAPGADAALEGLKALVMLGWGARSNADEIGAVARRHEPPVPRAGLR